MSQVFVTSESVREIGKFSLNDEQNETYDHDEIINHLICGFIAQITSSTDHIRTNIKNIISAYFGCFVSSNSVILGVCNEQKKLINLLCRHLDYRFVMFLRIEFCWNFDEASTLKLVDEEQRSYDGFAAKRIVIVQTTDNNIFG